MDHSKLAAALTKQTNRPSFAHAITAQAVEAVLANFATVKPMMEEIAALQRRVRYLQQLCDVKREEAAQALESSHPELCTLDYEICIDPDTQDLAVLVYEDQPGAKALKHPPERKAWVNDMIASWQPDPGAASN
jgi:hypothetical protein